MAMMKRLARMIDVEYLTANQADLERFADRVRVDP
jgi:hypothetical protein